VKVIRLSNGRLRIPLAVSEEDCDADGTETIGPGDPRYQEYRRIALTEEEHAARERGADIADAELLARWSARYEGQHGHQHGR
jgi:hypothetical protein